MTRGPCFDLVNVQPPCVADSLSQLPDEAQPGRQVELRAVLRQVVVQPQRVRFLADDQRRAHLVVEQVLRHQQPRVLYTLASAELALRRPADRLAGLWVGLALVEVDPDAPVRPWDVVPVGVVVLPGGALIVGPWLDPPGPHGDAALGAVDSDLLEQPRQGAQELGLRWRLGDLCQQQVCPTSGSRLAPACPVSGP